MKIENTFFSTNPSWAESLPDNSLPDHTASVYEAAQRAGLSLSLFSPSSGRRVSEEYLKEEDTIEVVYPPNFINPHIYPFLRSKNEAGPFIYMTQSIKDISQTVENYSRLAGDKSLTLIISIPGILSIVRSARIVPEQKISVILAYSEILYAEENLIVVKINKGFKKHHVVGAVSEEAGIMTKSAKLLEDQLSKILKIEREDFLDSLFSNGGFSCEVRLSHIRSLVAYRDILPSIEESITINLDQHFNPKESRSLAPVKPNVLAAMIASGSSGDLHKEVDIDSGEKAIIKAVMTLATATSKTKDFKKDLTRIHTVYRWAPRLGVFNKLRKTVEVLTN